MLESLQRRWLQWWFARFYGRNSKQTAANCQQSKCVPLLEHQLTQLHIVLIVRIRVFNMTLFNYFTWYCLLMHINTTHVVNSFHSSPVWSFFAAVCCIVYISAAYTQLVYILYFRLSFQKVWTVVPLQTIYRFDNINKLRSKRSVDVHS